MVKAQTAHCLLSTKGKNIKKILNHFYDAEEAGGLELQLKFEDLRIAQPTFIKD